MANTSSAKKRTRVIERKTKSRYMQKSKIRTKIFYRIVLVPMTLILKGLSIQY